MSRLFSYEIENTEFETAVLFDLQLDSRSNEVCLEKTLTAIPF